MNAGDADSYATMMQTTSKNFDRVVENVRRAAAIKRQIGARCAIKVQFLVYRDNYRQLPEMYRVFRETGADAFWFNGLYPVRPMPGMDESDIERMIELYEEVLAQDYFAHLERFSFWEQPVAERIAAAERRVFSARAPRAPRAYQGPTRPHARPAARTGSVARFTSSASSGGIRRPSTPTETW